MAELETELANHLQGLLAALSPAGRTTLARKLATELRRRQQRRIAAQQNPDGSAFEAKKPRLRTTGKIRRQMFSRLRTARHLKTRASADAAIVEITGRAARIAGIHQHGQRDRLGPLGPDYQYPVRKILGFTEGDLQALEDFLIDHLAQS